MNNLNTHKCSGHGCGNMEISLGYGHRHVWPGENYGTGRLSLLADPQGVAFYMKDNTNDNCQFRDAGEGYPADMEVYDDDDDTRVF